MYVCICNAVTEKMIRDAVDDGVRDMGELSATLGVATCCGSCEPIAREILNEELSEPSAMGGFYSVA